MKYRYLKIMAGLIWGKKTLSKEEFVNAIQRGDTIVDLEEMKVFNADENRWEEIKGDE